MATLDILILIVLAIGLLRGWRSGFLKQASALVGTVLAFVIAASFMESAGHVIHTNVGLPIDNSALIGFVGLFLLVKVAVNVVTKAASKLLETVNLSGLDRLAGGVTGAAKAAIAMSLVFVVIGFAQLPGQISRDSSEFYMPVYRIVPKAWSILADKSPAFDDLRRKVEDRLEFNADSVPI